ncbi:MAG TPA: hypothetical protein VLL76_09885 [Candidatus Omnitrophota bacterium]|nr:hypothetical protein [Candidatus Omnitrophota bacterium]
MSMVAEAASGIYGAWRLARRDPDGLKWFNATPQGFWRSFLAAVLVLPAVLGLEVLDGSLAADNFTGRKLAVELIAYVIQWTAFPLVMGYVADGLDRGRNYIRFVVAYNWSQVIQMAAFLPVSVAVMLVPNPAIALLSLIVMVMLLAYQAFVAHKALDVPVMPAIGVVILDMLLGGLVARAAGSMAG